ISSSTTVYVFEPSDDNLLSANLTDCSEWRFPWLIIVCIVLTVVEREPSEVDDYDPYHVNWISPNTGFGSRMSLNRTAVLNNSFNDSNKSNKSLRSHHLVYYRDHFVPKHYSTLQPPLQHTRPLSRYSTHSSKSKTSQKSRISQKSQKLPKIIEIDYSNDFKPYTYSLR
ncbi:unnamed protein product, partial [Oppiella nova]